MFPSTLLVLLIPTAFWILYPKSWRLWHNLNQG